MTKACRFKPHPRAEDRRRSATTALKGILELNLYPPHKKKLLSTCLWKLTEADGKYNLRFRTQESVRIANSKQLHHEHVHRRDKMVLALLADPARAEDISSCAVACIVTRAEHRELDRVDKAFPELDGWERYRKAGLTVIDLVSGDPLDLTSAQAVGT
jgi:hypothetical protein